MVLSSVGIVSKCSSSVGKVIKGILFREMLASIVFSVSLIGSIFGDRRRLSLFCPFNKGSKLDLAMLDLLSASEKAHSSLTALYDVMIAVF